jgi:hypothetical protein
MLSPETIDREMLLRVVAHSPADAPLTKDSAVRGVRRLLGTFWALSLSVPVRVLRPKLLRVRRHHYESDGAVIRRAQPEGRSAPGRAATYERRPGRNGDANTSPHRGPGRQRAARTSPSRGSLLHW